MSHYKLCNNLQWPLDKGHCYNAFRRWPTIAAMFIVCTKKAQNLANGCRLLSSFGRHDQCYICRMRLIVESLATFSWRRLTIMCWIVDVETEISTVTSTNCFSHKHNVTWCRLYLQLLWSQKKPMWNKVVAWRRICCIRVRKMSLFTWCFWYLMSIVEGSWSHRRGWKYSASAKQRQDLTKSEDAAELIYNPW